MAGPVIKKLEADKEPIRRGAGNDMLRSFFKYFERDRNSYVL